MWLAANYPTRVKSLSLHSPWPKTDPFLRNLVEGWQVMAKALESVAEMVIRSIFPWCLTPELYAAKPDHIQALSDFVRSRPAQPLEAFVRQSNAVLAHDVEAQLGRIKAPTQITFGPPRCAHLDSLREATEQRHHRVTADDLRGLRPRADLRKSG
jgi:pimeloyl-ACP methyl ester carboxylesterase